MNFVVVVGIYAKQDRDLIRWVVKFDAKIIKFVSYNKGWKLMKAVSFAFNLLFSEIGSQFSPKNASIRKQMKKFLESNFLSNVNVQ